MQVRSFGLKKMLKLVSFLYSTENEFVEGVCLRVVALCVPFYSREATMQETKREAFVDRSW